MSVIEQINRIETAKQRLKTILKNKGFIVGDEKLNELVELTNNITSSNEPYDGDYKIIPSITEQILETKNKYLIDNVTVTQIPYHTVSNESGGKTVTIGETPTDKNGETILLSL